MQRNLPDIEKKKVLLKEAAVLFAGILFFSCNKTHSTANAFIAKQIDVPPDTTLGPSDVFDVRVFGENDLTDTFRVASDGTIDFPLIGTVAVNGKTPSEVASEIKRELKEEGYLSRPEVSVFVKEYNSKKVSVFGQVKHPGTYNYEENMSVVEAVSIAGGFTSLAQENKTMVIRIEAGKEKRYLIPVRKIGQGRVPNFMLRTGDIIFVPERIF